MDNEKLMEKIQESGFKKTYIAYVLGLSVQGLNNKLNGKYSWWLTEINILIKLLDLTEDDVWEIFFANEYE